MYRCKPERNPRQAILLIVVLALLSFGGFCFSQTITMYKIFAQLAAIIFLALSISIVVRYTITEMEYQITHTDFTVTKTVGNKTTVLCSLALSSSIALVDKKTYLHSGDYSDVVIKYNHNQNLKADSHVYIYDFNGKKGMIEFEPNPTFVKIMKEAIDNAKKDNSSPRVNPTPPVID